jgi:chromosome segregation ATPase
MALQAKEISSLKLQVAELEDYKIRYLQQSQVALRSKESEISELHNELATVTEEHSTFITHVNHEKELLISQNGELKKKLSDAKLCNEMLESEVERQHTQMQTLRVQIKTEQKKFAKLKDGSGDLLKLQEELEFFKEHNDKMTLKVGETNDFM